MCKLKMWLDTSAAVLGCFAVTVSAVLVAQNSPCAVRCGNVLTETFPSDISCSAEDYQRPSGVVFQGCVECQLGSEFVNEDLIETDLQWALYNMRYATSYCLFGYPNHTDWDNNPCRTRTACGPLEEAIRYQNLDRNVSAYGYCERWDYGQIDECNSCLRAGEQLYPLKNFMTILNATCSQMPQKGSLVAFEGDAFSYTPVNMTDPAELLADEDFSTSSFSLGAKVGVAVAAVLAALTTIGLCIVWNGKRRRRAFLRKLESQHGHSEWPQPHQNDMFETPLSQKPLTGWTDSPVTPSEKHVPKFFSPYSSQYNSPTSGTEGPTHFQWPDDAQAQQMMVGLAFGRDDHGSSLHESSSKGKKKHGEEYELNEVDSKANQQFPRAPDAPVLHHPGYGRASPEKPQQPDAAAHY